MLTGKKFPQNVRALTLLSEELLRDTLELQTVNSMHDLDVQLNILRGKSRTSKLWIDCFIRPVLLVLKFIRAEREADFYLHLYVVDEMLKYFFSAQHPNYARYGCVYDEDMRNLPDEVREYFEKGYHVVHLKSGIWNAIW